MTDKVQDFKIEVVGSRSCRPCRMLKSRLLAEGYEFTYMDANDKENADRVKEIKKTAYELGARSYPVLFIDGKFAACGKNALMYNF